MADSEAATQEKTKEKKKKKAGSTKEKEPRKKSAAGPELQAEAKPPAEVEPPKTEPPPTELPAEAPQTEAPADTAAAAASAAPEGTKKSKKSKSGPKDQGKPDDTVASEPSAEARKASVAEGATRKQSTAAVSRKASAADAGASQGAAASTEDQADEESAEQGEEQGTKKTSDEPPPIESTYVVPPAATKKDINLLMEIDESKLMELKETFELFDYNQDGVIDYTDLKLTYQTLGYPDVEDDYILNMLAEAISPLDFDAFVVLLGYKTIEMDPEAVLVEALSCWDYDNSGLISEDRIKHDLMTWGDKFTKEEAEMALEDAPMYVTKKGASMIDYIKFSNTLCLRKKPSLDQIREGSP